MKRDRKEPLYRKEKKTGLETNYYVKRGGEARWNRHTKQTKREAEAEVSFKPMKKLKLDYDYSPLFMFLLSKVGEVWNDVYSEAKSRLDKEEPIWWMVARTNKERENGVVRMGESAYYSQLKVDENGILVKVDPDAKPFWLESCWIRTHSFNGKVYKQQSINA